MPPRAGFLWTPGYWGFAGGFYAWHAGYWGPHVGFYGGVNYGFGYAGVGFGGGMWVGGHFRYNTAVMNVNPTIVRNTYVNRTVINNTVVNRASFNGAGGVMTRPTASEMTAEREQHMPATSSQLSHEHSASLDRAQLASVNHGRPENAAISHNRLMAGDSSPRRAGAQGGNRNIVATPYRGNRHSQVNPVGNRRNPSHDRGEHSRP